MKSYFKFNLTGNKIFPAWLLFILLYIIPNTIVQNHIQELNNFNHSGTGMIDVFQRMGSSFSWRVLSLLLLVVEYAILFFIYKKTIEGIEFKEKVFRFVGKFDEFISLFIGNLLLTIITFGIYSPWFMTNVYKFFARNAKHDEHNFEFKGNGTDLFVIFLVTLIIPVMVVSAIGLIGAVLGGFMDALMHREMPEISGFVVFLVIFETVSLILIFVCLTYYFYKWFVNLSFKDYEIKWETVFWPSAQQLFIQIGLSVITFGIYSPLGSLRLYKYFMEKTVATNETSLKKFGYDLAAGDDFLFIWGQVLLCIITLGIYFPWAYCKISNYVLSKTYVEG